jgi:RPA family protein
MGNKKRLTAKKVRIKDILNGKYFPGSKEEMKPSYVVTNLGQKISRVNLVATVIDKFLSEDENYLSLTIDDGTEAMRVKVFGEKVELLKNIDIGDLIMVIGKLKEYNAEVYVNGEIIKKVDDPNYENLRKLEILKELIDQKKVVENIRMSARQMPREELKKKFGISEEILQTILESKLKQVDYKPKILQLIENLSGEKGIEVSKLFELVNLPENIVENTVNELLESGMLFEPTPGRLKKV